MVSLCSINRDSQRYTGRQRCNSSKTKAQSFYRRPPKHSKTALFLFFFDSRRTSGSNRGAAPHCFDGANRYALCTTFIPSHWRSRSMTWTPPNSSAALAPAVLLQLHDRDFSLRVAKERLSKSFAFDSFQMFRGLFSHKLFVKKK